jgi:hypothetical protein
MPVPDMAVDDKLRRVIPPDLKVGLQQAGKKVAAADMQVAEAQGNAGFHL